MLSFAWRNLRHTQSVPGIMNISREITIALLSTVLGAAVHAQTAKTRAQVNAELSAAVRAGDLLQGEAGLRLNELHPGSYALTINATSISRAQVIDELSGAIRSGDVVVGETGATLRERYSNAYPARPTSESKARSLIRAEAAQAVLSGSIPAGEREAKTNQ